MTLSRQERHKAGRYPAVNPSTSKPKMMPAGESAHRKCARISGAAGRGACIPSIGIHATICPAWTAVDRRHVGRAELVDVVARAHGTTATELRENFTARCIRVVTDDRLRDVTAPTCSADGSYHVPGCPLYQT